MFKTAAGIDFTIIPYRGTPEIQVALLQGDVALMIDSYSSMKGNLADNKLRALAFDQMLRAIREEEPMRPSVRLSSEAGALALAAAYRGSESQKLIGALRGEHGVQAGRVARLQGGQDLHRAVAPERPKKARAVAQH